MYKILIAAMMMACLVGCGAQPTGSQSVPSSSMTQSEAVSDSQTEANRQATPTPAPASSSENPSSAGSQPTQTPAPAATKEPLESTEQNDESNGSNAATTAYGAVPFEYATGTDKWWYIDSSDTAYPGPCRTAASPEWPGQAGRRNVSACAGQRRLSVPRLP